MLDLNGKINMSIKVEVHEAKVTDKELDYPFVGRSIRTNTIVLFTKPRCGVVLAAGGCSPIGCYYTDWHMHEFKETSSITLTIDSVQGV